MSARAYALIQEAIQILREEDGASELGSYRDVVTDVLHQAYEDPEINKGEKTPGVRHLLKDMILTEAMSMFEEEIEDKELKKIALIPRDELPLHTNREWETEEGTNYFRKRLEGDAR